MAPGRQDEACVGGDRPCRARACYEGPLAWAGLSQGMRARRTSVSSCPWGRGFAAATGARTAAGARRSATRSAGGGGALDLGGPARRAGAEVMRVRCPEHGVVAEAVPWARHHTMFCRASGDQVARLAPRMRGGAPDGPVCVCGLAHRGRHLLEGRSVARGGRAGGPGPVGTGEASHEGGPQARGGRRRPRPGARTSLRRECFGSIRTAQKSH